MDSDNNNNIELMMNTLTSQNNWNVVKRDGKTEPVLFDKISKRVRQMSTDLNVNVMDIVQKVISSMYNGISSKQIDQETAEVCIGKLTLHPDYGKLASRITISNIHKNTSPSFSEVTQTLYNNTDIHNNHCPLINKRYYDFVLNNAKKINNVIMYDKDYNLDYFGIKTLERAYLWRVNDNIVERPQHMFMRVALSIHKDDLKEAIKCYKGFSDGYFIHATPTLFNMGSNREQASSCFLVNIKDDSIDGIADTWKDCSKISKYAGGIGVSIHKIRAKNSTIRGTNGKTDGVCKMLKVFNEIACYVNQAGKRKGSIAIYLETWHADIQDFLMLRRNTGAESERARDLFYALWVSDLFMKRVKNNEKWTLMCPDKCPGLHLVYGEEFVKLYEKYESEGRGTKTIDARTLWNTILDSQIETGTPYIGYKDAVNIKNNQKNLGTIQSSNLCHEIVEFTSPEEIAVCNLASIALPKYVKFEPIESDGSDEIASSEDNKSSNGTKSTEGIHGSGGNKKLKPVYDFKLLRDMTKLVTKNLNKIIDHNFYPVKEAETSNRRHRPVGIGVQGLADVFALMRIPFDSQEARVLNRKIFENIYYASLEASMEIAKKRKRFVQEYKRVYNQKVKNPDYKYTEEEVKQMDDLKETHFIIDEELKLQNQYAGAYSSFIGSPMHQGKFQFDLWNVECSPEMEDEWNNLRADIKKHGIRNSLLVALMPTASTSQILSNNECFEPYTNNIYTRRTLAGTFIVINKHLVNDLLELNLWNKDMKDKIILANGSVQNIDEIPDDIKALYKTVWEIKQKSIIDLAADRSPFIDQTQSLNLFVESPTYKKLSSMHFYSWEKGLKTGIYYLRSKAKTNAQKFSVDITKSISVNKSKSLMSNSDNTAQHGSEVTNQISNGSNKNTSSNSGENVSDTNSNSNSQDENANKSKNDKVSAAEAEILACSRDNPDCLMCSA